MKQSLNDFWPAFLSTHLHPKSRKMHLIGNLVFFTCLFFSLLLGKWSLFFAGFSGYLFAWYGHFVYEKGFPATFHDPIKSALCDFKMIGYIFAGEIDKEIERLFGSRNPQPHSPVLVSIEEERAYQKKLSMKISDKVGDHPFTDYWDIFVLKHQIPTNVWIHVAAMVFLYFLIALSFVTGNWTILVFIPLSQISGLLSHRRFEPTHIDFEDAIFSWRAFRSLNRMMVMAIGGTYFKERDRLLTLLENSKNQQA